MDKNQMEIISVDQLVPKNHAYRKMREIIDFEKIVSAVGLKDSEKGATGFTVFRLVMCMILQFIEDLSDREFQRFIAENLAAKWFCDFGLSWKTPDYSTVCKFRKKLGTKRMGIIFDEVKSQLNDHGYTEDIFHFVDSTALISKLQMWEERDKAIADGYEKLNNKVIGKYAADKDVRIGAKSKTKFWYGYKKTVSVGMKHGFINKIAVTKANVNDADAVKHVLPKAGFVCGDKGFIPAIKLITGRGLEPLIILKNNMKEKNHYHDSWVSKLRAPYEGTFSKQNNRTRYKGVAKNQGAEFMHAIAFNLRRLLALEKSRGVCCG